jgi:hypothetical protein
MPPLDQELEWSKEFEKIGETEIRNDLNFRSGVNVGINSEPKQQYALKWLRRKEQERADREESTHQYVKWTFWAAVAAVMIGIELDCFIEIGDGAVVFFKLNETKAAADIGTAGAFRRQFNDAIIVGGRIL